MAVKTERERESIRVELISPGQGPNEPITSLPIREGDIPSFNTTRLCVSRGNPQIKPVSSTPAETCEDQAPPSMA